MPANNYFITDQNAVYFLTANHAILLDNMDMIDQRDNWMHENPVRALIVVEPHEYLFGSARDHVGNKDT